ncbi:MAG TPA: hypothetical protein PKM59_11645 [Thermodesulfobacteriota bacterium]|nr:hypothetical protein [Thermodesulfobacteriota bacterium]HNU70387.1 hypothetical protein [Thermodesulfobacteriota bacterium]
MKRQTIPHIVMDELWYGAFVAYNYSDVSNVITVSVMSDSGYLAQTITKTIPAFGRVVIDQEDVEGRGTFSIIIDGPDDLMIVPQQLLIRSGVFLPIPVYTPTGTLKNL